MDINTTKLLGIIIREMSSENIEITNVEIYEEAVKINNKVKVLITNDGYIVHRVNEGGGIRCWSNDRMVDKVLELLKPDFREGDCIVNGHKAGILVRVDEDKYAVVDFNFNSKSLEELHEIGWRKG